MAVTYIVTDSFWAKAQKHSTALGMCDRTGLMLIRAGAEQANSLQHERLHMIAKNFSDHLPRSAEPLTRLTTKTEKIKRQSFSSYANHSLAEELSNRDFCRELINGLHEELLAEFQIANPTLSALRDVPFTPANYKKFDTLYTAGLQAKQVVAFTEEQAKQEPFVSSPHLRQALAVLRHNFVRQFEAMIKQLAEASVWATENGPDAEAELWAVLITLKPSEYHHLASYLGSYTGLEKKSYFTS